jgi:hypothetical protein
VQHGGKARPDTLPTEDMRNMVGYGGSVKNVSQSISKVKDSI